MILLKNELGILRSGKESDCSQLLFLAESNDLSEFGDPFWKPANINDFSWPKFEVGQSTRIDLVIDTKMWGPVGTCCLHRIDWRSRNASIGIVIYEKGKRRIKIGSATIVALQEWASRSLYINRLEAYILIDNLASERLFQKCAFVKEGVLRKRYLRGGELVDVLVYGWLSDE